MRTKTRVIYSLININEGDRQYAVPIAKKKIIFRVRIIERGFLKDETLYLGLFFVKWKLAGNIEDVQFKRVPQIKISK